MPRLRRQPTGFPFDLRAKAHLHRRECNKSCWVVVVRSLEVDLCCGYVRRTRRPRLLPANCGSAFLAPNRQRAFQSKSAHRRASNQNRDHIYDCGQASPATATVLIFGKSLCECLARMDGVQIKVSTYKLVNITVTATTLCQTHLGQRRAPVRSSKVESCPIDQ